MRNLRSWLCGGSPDSAPSQPHDKLVRDSLAQMSSCFWDGGWGQGQAAAQGQGGGRMAALGVDRKLEVGLDPEPSCPKQVLHFLPASCS